MRHAMLPIPDARLSPEDGYPQEIASLLRIIRDQCRGPAGQRPTVQQVSDLLGLTDATLYEYQRDKPFPGRTFRSRARFPVVYALRALVAALPATQAALWSDHGQT